jgi:hypothetical protein
MFKNWMKKQFVIRPLRVIKEPKKHRLEVLYAFLASFLFSIGYGIFEYTVMYTNPGYVSKGIITPYVNWAIMYTCILVLMIGVTRVKIEWILLGVFFFLMFEDLVYHICYGIDIQAYPFPVYDWWDEYLASFRVLGNLGQAIPFWPYVPLYYLPGFGMIIIMFIVGFANAKGARIVNWILEPFILAVIIGLLGNDLFAIISLAVIPTIVYSYIITLTILKKKGIIEIQQEEVLDSQEENDLKTEFEVDV